MSIDPASALMAVEAAVGDATAEARAETAPGALSPVDEGARSPASQPASQTAMDQVALEAEARDVLPYSFDTCTNDMGPLRQGLYACLTCNPPPAEGSSVRHTPAGVCYACSISCHGEHDLVELFTRRNFVCDCGTTRLPASAPCTLRVDPITEQKGVHSQEPTASNTYNKNFRNRFCSCNELYDPQTQTGTMFQCIGLATEEEGGCGEDWWHPECLLGLPRDWYTQSQKAQESKGAEAVEGTKTKGDSAEDAAAAAAAPEEHPVPPGFPDEESFDHVVCFKCIEKAPFLKKYANYPGFTPIYRDTSAGNGSSECNDKAGVVQDADATTSELSKKRSRDEGDDGVDSVEPALKKTKSESGSTPAPVDGEAATTTISACKLADLPPAPTKPMSLLLPEGFREQLCRCREHYLELRAFPMFLEEEETYEPPVSEDGGGANGDGGSVGKGSLLEMGEEALGSMDRVRAIEGVMAYNHVKDKVKDFLKPFADSGKLVSAEEIKAYFEKLRGDHEAIRDARARRGGSAGGDDADDGDGDGRREQSGY